MTSTAASPEILIVAAEASSSLYAQRLLEHWQKTNFKVKAFGIGSRAMESLGFEILGRSENLAVVGLQEVVSHFGEIRQAFNGLLEAARERKPKVALLLDYPDFNLRLAKKLKKMGIPVVYYISPQIWAWRQSRVHTIRKIVDEMLVLFPFEKEFYQKFNVPVEFVGHPLLDELDPLLFDSQDREIHRTRFAIHKDDVVLALMPGSRRSELKHHLQLQLDVAEKLAATHKNLKVAMFVAPTFTVEEFKSFLPPVSLPLMLIKDEPFKMIQIADLVLCASGTATLIVGLMEKPMVIMYRMNSFTAMMAKIFVRSTAHFGLINLVLGQRAVPELFQEQASLDNLVAELSPLIGDRSAREKVAGSLALAKDRLGNRGATVRVAKTLEKYWRLQ